MVMDIIRKVSSYVASFLHMSTLHFHLLCKYTRKRHFIGFSIYFDVVQRTGSQGKVVHVIFFVQLCQSGCCDSTC